ncbi:MAG: FAD-dependent oxidoreductase [Dehalobacterium sp.]
MSSYDHPSINQYPHLFSPKTVKNTTFKNRIFIAPAGMNQVITPYSMPRHDAAVSYGMRIRSGAAVLTLNETLNDQIYARAHDCQFDMTNPLILNPFQQVVDYAHFFDAKASIELTHVGQWALPQLIGRNPKGPSAGVLPNGSTVEEMTEGEMDFYIDGFVNAAVMAKRGGFDMALVHGGHGWLLHQFLSPLDNCRKDKFGGSLENRARFPIMVLDAIRKAVGPDFILEYRISVSEATEGGLEPEETIEFIKMIEDKIDIVQCSVGCRRDARTRAIMHPTHFLPSGCNVYLAEAVKKSGVKIPVTAIGAISNPALAESIIAEGKADFVAMIRNVIADPEWVEKAKSGRPDDIRPCLRCLHCLDTVAGRVGVSKVVAQNFTTASRRTECSVNPTWGREHMMHYYEDVSCKEHKKIVIIGGGPAGISAALESAKKENKVILFEKTEVLGGQFTFANYDFSFKQDHKRYLDYLIRQINNTDIDLRLNTIATPEIVVAEKPDAVIIAVGADPFIPPIPGVDKPNVFHAIKAIQNVDTLGQKIVVVGGGMVGCETALHLAQLGREVTVLEMGADLMPDGLFTERLHTLQFLEPMAKTFVNMRCTEITDEGVYATDDAGKSNFFPADTIVMATGMCPNKKVKESFFGTAYEVVSVGDCVKLGNLVNAVRTGFDAGMRL